MTTKEVQQFAEDWLFNDHAEFPQWPTQAEMARFIEAVKWEISVLQDYQEERREGYDAH